MNNPHWTAVGHCESSLLTQGNMQACPSGRANNRSPRLTVVEANAAALGSFFSPWENWCMITR